jgi:V8-like Glu-specific endopeptidase
MAEHRFIGDHSAPTPLARVRAKRPALGTGQIPEALRAMARTQSLYLKTETHERPEVKIVSIGSRGQHEWRIDVPVHEQLSGRRLGLIAERHPSEKFLAEVDEHHDFKARCPEWADLLTVPQVFNDRATRTMRRFNGRRVEPTWVFDSARSAFNNDAWPLGLVGRITNSDGKAGTGTLIGDRIVATAAHVIPWNSVAAGSWWMQFTPAYFNGQSLFGAGVTSFVSDCMAYNNGNNVSGYDWAVLRLYEPLGQSLGYMGYNSYSSDWNNLGVWSNIGYPGDIDNGQEPVFQQGFSINDTDGDSNGGQELESQNADIYFGQSGGPIYAWWNNGTDPRLVGVVSGQENETDYTFPLSFDTHNDNVFAGGDGFCNLMAWGRANWPA